MTSLSDYDYDTELYFAHDSSHGYVALSKLCVNKEQFVGQLLLVFEDDKVVASSGSEVSEREGKYTKALFYLSTEQINGLKAGNIRTVKYRTNNSGKEERGSAVNKGSDTHAIASDFFAQVALTDKPLSASETTDDKPLMVADQMPSFPGGQEAMYRYIYEKIKYPANAREKRISGQVIVEFIVQADGEITDPLIVRGIGGGCDEEVLRVVNSMPKWVPAVHGGKNVAAYYTLPIKFVVQ